MFNYKYDIKFSNSEIISLYGEDYFADKKNFWMAHQSNLKNLCQKVCLLGFPLSIVDLINNDTLNITNKKEFDNWMTINQPYKCNCNS